MEMYPAPNNTCNLELLITIAHHHRLNVKMPSLDHSADRSLTCCRWSSDMRAMGIKALTSALYTSDRCLNDVPKIQAGRSTDSRVSRGRDGHVMST